MKRLLIVMAVVSLVSACSAGSGSEALAQTTQLNSKTQTALAKSGNIAKFSLGNYADDLTLLQQQQRDAIEAQQNNSRIAKAVKRLKKTAGKTWYVFSGATPSGWDCSGLVVWFYEQLGVTLEHSATKQLYSGKHVKKPEVGDIVAFSYPGSSRSFHVGIYIGNGKVIHAYYYGKRTVIQSVAEVQKENGNAKVTYIRILDSTDNLDATL